MVKINCTFDSVSFKGLNIPSFDDTTFSSMVVIPNIKLNKTYYTYYNNALTAFKVLAISFDKTHFSIRKWYLISRPNEIPTWENADWFDRPIFNDLNDYVLNLNNHSKPKIETCRLDVLYPEIQLCGASHDKSIIRFNKTFFNDNGIIKNTDSVIKHILITKDVITFHLSHSKYGTNKKYFETYDECKESMLNNLIVKSFENDTKEDYPIKLDIEIPVQVIKKYKLTEI